MLVLKKKVLVTLFYLFIYFNLLFSDWVVTLTKRGCSTCVHAGDFLNIMVKKTKQGTFSLHFLRHPSFILIGCKSNHKKIVGLHFKASYFWNVLIVNFLNYLGIEAQLAVSNFPFFLVVEDFQT